MATQVQFRRGTTTDISTFIGADGEVVVDTTKKTCVVHDGIQVAGYPLLREDGSNSALNAGNLSSCALKFINDPNTGIISPGADQIALVTGGASRLSIDSSGSVTIPGNLLVSGSLTGALTLDDGSAAVPALRFTNDPDTGIYLSGTNEVAISTGGTQRLTTTTTAVTSTLPVIHPLGAAATPSLTFAGDTNTGIYSSGSDQVAISTGGTQRLTTTTTEVTSTLPVIHPLGAAATPSLTFAGDTNTGIYSPGADQVAISTNGTGRLFIDSSGNVGIGTSPSYSFHLTSTESATNFVIDNPTRGGFITAFRNGAGIGGVGNVGALLGDTTEDLGVYAATSKNIRFYSGGVTERMRLDSSGRLGLGTSTATERLTVAGNISLSAAQPYISLVDSGWGAGTVIRSGVNTLGTATGDYQLFNVPTGKGFAFAQNNTANSLVIDASNRVGIGTSSPQSPLHVVGSSVTLEPANPGNVLIKPAKAGGAILIRQDENTTDRYLALGQVDNLGAFNELSRLDNSGKLLVGTSTSIGSASGNYPIQAVATGAGGGAVASLGLNFTPDASGFLLGGVEFNSLATSWRAGASIVGWSDGVHSSTSRPSRLVFSTTADGASSPTERMRITSAGNVGIGTTGPNGLLDVRSATTWIGDGTTDAFLQFNQSATAADRWHIGTGSFSSNALIFYKGTYGTGSETARIDSSGRLGLGTSIPAVTLDVANVHGINNSITRPFRIRNYGQVSATGYGVGMSFFYPNGTTSDLGFEAAAIDSSYTSGGNFGNLIFSTNNNTGVAERMRISSAGTTTLTSAASTAPFIANIGVSEAARIDSSGRLLVGTSIARSNFFNTVVSPQIQLEGTGDFDRQSAIISSSSTAAFGAVQILAHQKSGVIGGNTLVANNDSLGIISFQGSDGTQFVEAARIESLVDGTPGSDDMPARLVFSTTADGASSPTERMRINSNGNLLINTTTEGAGIGFNTKLAIEGDDVAVFKNSLGASANLIYAWNAGTTGNNAFVAFGTEGTYTQRGQINYNRSSGVVAYNTTSDYRAKTLIGEIENPGETIDALKVYRGVMNGATVERPMLVAHEAQEVAPYCVTGEKDAVDDDGNPIYQQMDHQVLVPLLIAEIQQLRARVAALEGV